jgi:hypothetical protein
VPSESASPSATAEASPTSTSSTKDD